MRGSSFFCANLNNSTIKNADLRDADFIVAQLNDVILENVILKNSDLSFAVSNKLSICKSDTHDFLRLYPQLQIEFSEGTLVLSVSDELKSFRVTGIPVGTFEPSSGIYYQTLGRFDSA